MRQKRWLELLKDNDMSFQYNPSKENITVDAFSRLSKDGMALFREANKEFLKDVHHLARLNVRLSDSNKGGIPM